MNDRNQMTEEERNLERQQRQKNYRPFKQKYPFEERVKEMQRQQQVHPNMVPVIVEWHPNSKNIMPLAKKKFLVEKPHRLAEFQQTIKNKLELGKGDTVLFFIGKNQLSTPDQLMGDVYDQKKDEDGFLYITYCDFNPFGFSN